MNATHLRRGFKTEARDMAREVRSELKLSAVDPLPVLILAEHLAIPVRPLSDAAAAAPFAAFHFSCIEPDAFSAVTVFYGAKRLIVHNDSHTPGRQASNITHELAHGLLLHPPTPPLGAQGCRNWNPRAEAEADWLAAELLVTEQTALRIVRAGWSEEEAAKRYGISKKMVRYRLNVTGARRRVERAARYGVGQRG